MAGEKVIAIRFRGAMEAGRFQALAAAIEAELDTIREGDLLMPEAGAPLVDMFVRGVPSRLLGRAMAAVELALAAHGLAEAVILTTHSDFGRR
jgi:hypothetical protein